jgi:hypothetical protein
VTPEPTPQSAEEPTDAVSSSESDAPCRERRLSTTHWRRDGWLSSLWFASWWPARRYGLAPDRWSESLRVGDTTESPFRAVHRARCLRGRPKRVLCADVYIRREEIAGNQRRSRLYCYALQAPDGLPNKNWAASNPVPRGPGSARLITAGRPRISAMEWHGSTNPIRPGTNGTRQFATAAFLGSPLVYCGGDAFPSYRAFHTKKLPSASCR